MPIGICGLVKRDALTDADIGYALLPRFWSMGYAYESASAVMTYGMNVLGLKRLLAVTNQDNAGSIKVLEKIGLKFTEWSDCPWMGQRFSCLRLTHSFAAGLSARCKK